MSTVAQVPAGSRARHRGRAASPAATRRPAPVVTDVRRLLGALTLAAWVAVAAIGLRAAAEEPGGAAVPAGALAPPALVGLLPAPPPPGVASPGSYEVAAGDTASGIAAAHGVTVAALVDANDLASPDALGVGQQLVIPPPSD